MAGGAGGLNLFGVRSKVSGLAGSCSPPVPSAQNQSLTLRFKPYTPKTPNPKTLKPQNPKP